MAKTGLTSGHVSVFAINKPVPKVAALVAVSAVSVGNLES